MATRGWTGAVAAIGGLLVVGAGALPNPAFGGSWAVLGVSYLLAASLLGGFYHLRNRRPPLPGALAVAVVTLLALMAIRVWGLLQARPKLGITDAGFVLRQTMVFVPAVAGFMAPLGLAEQRNEKVIAAAAMLAVLCGFLLGSVLSTTDSGFGAGFAVFYYGFWFVGGALLGLPLYLYGRGLRGGWFPTLR